MLVFLFFDAAGIGDQLLDHVKVHQRLAAEKVHLQIMSGPGVFHQKVQRTLTHLKTHQRTITMVFSLTGKAVGAIEIAGVGNVQAKRLNHAGGPGFQFTRHGRKGILGKQLSRRFQLDNLVVTFADLIRRHAVCSLILFPQLFYDGVTGLCFKQSNHIVSQFVHGMYRTGANVQHNIITA